MDEEKSPLSNRRMLNRSEWQHEADELIKTNPDILDKALGLGAFDFFKFRIVFGALIGLFAVSIVNTIHVPTSKYAYLPLMLYMFSLAVFRRYHSSIESEKVFVYHVDFTTILLVIGALITHFDFVQNNTPVMNAPIQITLVAACALSFHSFKTTLIRNILLSAFVAGVVAAYDANMALRISSQFIVGAVVGTIFNCVFDRLFFREGYITAKFSKESVRAYNELSKRTLPHQMEMIKEGAKLEETMPTDGINDAIVYKCDIVNSSALAHPKKKSVFHNAVLKVEEFYQSSYRPLSLSVPPMIEGSAYYIKPAGDAFFASSKWPFQLPEGESEFEAVHRTALNSIKILSETMNQIAERPVTCCMSVATGPIDGVFSGQRSEYDIAGIGIDLAERYETVRKVISDIETKVKSGYHAIILQNRVYEALDRNFSDFMATKYRMFSLKSNVSNPNVRGDESGTEVYVYFIPHQHIDKELEEFENYIATHTDKLPAAG